MSLIGLKNTVSDCSKTCKVCVCVWQGGRLSDLKGVGTGLNKTVSVSLQTCKMYLCVGGGVANLK